MTTPYLSEIRIMSFGFAPKGWAQCNGQLLAINQNQALFALLGTVYGGDGRVTFALPDLRGRVPMGMGDNHVLGERAGEYAHFLQTQEMPAHNHGIMTDAATAGASNTNTPSSSTVLGQSAGLANPGGPFTVGIYNTGGAGGAMATQVIGPAGGGQPHDNVQPYLTFNFCIALQGVFPTQT